MERHIKNLNWMEFGDLVKKIKGVILPIGTMEAHGCTNLGTDITIPEYQAEYLAEKLDLLIAPSINYGITRTLLPYSGSMTVTQESFIAYVSEISQSLIRNGFEWILYLNGHGGHIQELTDIGRSLWKETGGKSISIHWWELCEKLTREFFGEAGGHAGLDETAMVMAANPDLVKENLYSNSIIFQVRAGAQPYPQGGTILLYEEKQGKPRFDKREADSYANEVNKHLETYIKEVLVGWRKGQV